MINDQTFKQQIGKHDECKIWARKLKMLKEGLLCERKEKQKMLEKLKKKEQLHHQLVGEIEWKSRQNQTLIKEIKNIKDQILQQRNKKRKLREEIIALENIIDNGSDQAKTADTKKEKEIK